MKKLRYPLLLLLQAAGMLVLSYLLLSLLWVSGTLYQVSAWAVLPLLGAVSAYLVTVKGINCYLGWIAPPAMGLLAHYLAFFYLPASAGPFFVCAVVSVIGAAAGDVVKKSKRK